MSAKSFEEAVEAAVEKKLTKIADDLAQRLKEGEIKHQEHMQKIRLQRDKDTRIRLFWIGIIITLSSIAGSITILVATPNTFGGFVMLLPGVLAVTLGTFARFKR